MATSKDSLQVHAKRLREMAEVETGAAAACHRYALQPRCEPFRESALRCEAKAASLLAGAAALEAVEVAKAGLNKIVRNRIGDVGECASSRPCNCSECVAAAALSRLEAL